MRDYPTQIGPVSDAMPAERARPNSHRYARVFFDLGLLAAIVVLLVWLRQVSDVLRHPAEPRGPLDFKTVQERFANVHALMRMDEVFYMLGPQCSARFWEPEFDSIEAMAEAHPDRYPGERFYAKWSDPEDESKWVAVLFVGGYVHLPMKKGF